MLQRVVSRVERCCFIHVNAKVDYAGVLLRNESYQHLSGPGQDQNFLKNPEMCQTGSDQDSYGYDTQILTYYLCLAV